MSFWRLNKRDTAFNPMSLCQSEGIQIRCLARGNAFLYLPSTGAERTGFEPADQYDPVASLAMKCFRPLSHLSESAVGIFRFCQLPRILLEFPASCKPTSVAVCIFRSRSYILHLFHPLCGLSYRLWLSHKRDHVNVRKDLLRRRRRFRCTQR